MNQQTEAEKHIAAEINSPKIPTAENNPTGLKTETISTQELLDWAEDLRKQYAAGILPSWQLKALEATPGWHW